MVPICGLVKCYHTGLITLYSGVQVPGPQRGRRVVFDSHRQVSITATTPTGVQPLGLGRNVVQGVPMFRLS